MANDKDSLRHDAWHQIGLLELSHMLLFGSSLSILFGINGTRRSEIEGYFGLFDSSIHLFFAFLPKPIYSVICRGALHARAALNHIWSISDYNESQFANYYRRIIEKHITKEQATDEKGAFQTAFLWSSIGNTIPALFWTLFYILNDQNALHDLRDEIDINLGDFSDFDTHVNEKSKWSAENIARCVRLDSAIKAALRLASAPLLPRICDREPTAIPLVDGRIVYLEPGDSIALFPALIHQDGTRFGPDPGLYKYDRFLNHTDSTTYPFFAPFGFKPTICPGRLLAMNELKICIALVLRYLTVEFVSFTHNAPDQYIQRIGFGVAPPSRDVPVRYQYTSSFQKKDHSL